MKMVFIQSECESFGIELLSSILKANGHEVHLIFDPRVFDSTEIKSSFLSRAFDIKKQLIDKIIEIKPDLVGFSVFTYNYQWALSFSRLVKKRVDVPIIFGGVHPTLVPEEVIKNDCVDMVCVGEGEHAFLELANSPKRTDIDNIWFKKKGKVIKNEVRKPLEDLDSLPFPDKAPFYKKIPLIKRTYSTVVGRGCPFSCTYCATSALKNTCKKKHKYCRRRSVENVIEELKLAKKQFKPKDIIFMDDVFTSDINWLREFSKRYRAEINLPFFCYTHPNSMNEEKAVLLKRMGCVIIGMGIQTGSEPLRENVLNRFTSNKQIVSAAKALHKAKLTFSIDHIFNIPFEKEDDYLKSLELYNEIRPSVINTFWLTFFPKTEIIQHAIKAGVLKEEDLHAIRQGKSSTSMYVGVGGDYSFGKIRKHNFQFWMAVLPLLSKNIMKLVIRKGWYRSPSFRIPLPTIVFLKLLNRILIGRAIDTLFTFNLLFRNMISNKLIKAGLKSV
ncbi:MAG: cobalamin-dependent protein [Candidatus Aenigmarchaeota archaeon]|nr:cobalamin-dependent protein [Candidatus Aenigmarchaeota archaeon]